DGRWASWYRAPACAVSGGRKRLPEQHHRDAVADREPLAALGADQVLPLLAHRRVVLVGAGQDLEELAVDRHLLIFGLDGHVNICLTCWPTPTAGFPQGSAQGSWSSRRDRSRCRSSPPKSRRAP